VLRVLIFLMEVGTVFLRCLFARFHIEPLTVERVFRGLMRECVMLCYRGEIAIFLGEGAVMTDCPLANSQNLGQPHNGQCDVIAGAQLLKTARDAQIASVCW